MVLVSHTHSLWMADRKTSKRYGRLAKSPAQYLHEMVALHRNEVFAFIQQRAKMKSESSTEAELEPKEDIVMSTEGR